MATINWDNSLSVKIESIDNQHKILIDLINKFYDKSDSSDNNKKMLKLVTGMQEYTIFHFNKEEKLMTKLNYPDYKNHKKEHDLFINQVNNYIIRLKTGKLLLSVEITNYLKNWLINHISVSDKAYSDFFINNGVK